MWLEKYGAIDLAPPEQQSFAHWCKPDAKNDVFAFSTTMYRLCTQKKQGPFRERNLPKVPALRDLLVKRVIVLKIFIFPFKIEYNE